MAPALRLRTGDSLFIAAYGLTHYALALLGFALAVGASNVPWFWPAAGLLPTVFAVSPPRLRIAILISAGLAERAAAAYVGQGVLDPGGLLITLANLTEAVAGAAAVAALLASPWHRRTSVEILAIVCVGALVVPLLGAGIQGLMAWQEFGAASGSTTLGSISAWWAADVLGIVLINPLVGCLLLWRAVPGSVRVRHYAGVAAILLIWLVLAFQLTAPPSLFTDPVTSLALLAAATLAILMLAAFTLPPVLVSAMVVIVALVLNFSTRLPGTYMAQMFAGPDGPHFAARTLLLAGSVWCCMVALVRFERRYVTQLAQHRRAPHHVIAELASRLAQCAPENADEHIVEGLQTVGRTCGADRCVIFEFDRQNDTFSQSHRWCRPGVEDIKGQLQGLPLSGVSELATSAEQKGTAFIRASDVDPASALGQYLAMGNAWAVAYAPLRTDHRVTGVLGLTWQQPSRRWGIDSSVVLQSAAQVIGRTLSRTRSAFADAAYRDKLRALTARLEQLDTVVRRETAADLHDGAAQSLAVARLRLARIRQNSDADGELQAVEEMIVAALTEIRGVIKRMVPSALYELGLAHALREFVSESAAQLEVELALTTQGQIDPLPAELAGLFYRAARELVTNALKHSGAGRVGVDLDRSANQIIMTVTDDGCGFQARRSGQMFADGTGLGLFGLHERLARAGGTIRVQSDAQGSRIVVRAPLDRTLEPAAEAAAAEIQPSASS